jgi:hypothetical protein
MVIDDVASSSGPLKESIKIEALFYTVVNGHIY